ncbi:aldo/keto reductase [Microlunatus ginsengisoli]|uniref:Aldo/keto reductase n=1 Tax=Microlunatus ginsengisoli TaxID=363863 RepID=A0ABP6ZZJ8_9ACTN
MAENDGIPRLRWAVLGPGAIARRFVSQLPSCPGARLVAIGSSDPARAARFAAEHAAEIGADPSDLRTGTYEDVLGDPGVDAVYVATVHTTHPQLTIAALEAGKHVLCEKPLAANHAAAMAMAEVARTTGRTLVEAYMYRFHPQTRRVLELVAAGAVGDMLHIDASFAFRVEQRTGRLFDPGIAGGGILDVGGYPVSYARAVAGAATGRPFAEPTDVRARGTLGPTGVDEWAVAALTFPGGIGATVRTGVRLDEPQVLRVYGARGVLHLDDPWTMGTSQRITITTTEGGPEVIEFGGDLPYGLEAEGLARATQTGDTPQMSLDDSLGNARALDAWREQLGLRYPFEADDADLPTVSGRPLRVSAEAAMPTGRIPGVELAVSRLVMGCDNQQTLPHASAVFDHFFAAGGNTFDTGYIYGDGRQERLLGRWIANRGVRDRVAIIVKGAHTPHCDPESISSQLGESLERLGTDHADLYLMHRDNLAVGVDEFVDVLDAELRAGRIRAFGGSNWSPARIDAANAYAERAGRHSFSLLSNHFGLAEAYDVPWAGCEHVTDPASKRWLVERQLPLFPWSSQARGFFAGRAHPDDRRDPELVRCYYSDANFERLRRAEHLAAEFGVAPTAIALAYVLHQPFPTYPLFGPRTIAESASSMAALRVRLTPDQVAWLDLRDPA